MPPPREAPARYRSRFCGKPRRLLIVGSRLRTRRSLSTDAKIVIVERGIEQQEEAALRLVAPHRIVREHHHVTASNWNVDYCRLVRKIRTAGEHSAHQQILFVGDKAHDYPWPKLRWCEKRARTLLVGNLFFARSAWWLAWHTARHRLDHVGIGQCAATRRPTGWTPTSAFTAATTESPATARCGHLKQRRLIKIDRQRISTAIGNRALAIGERSVVDRSARLQSI